jgi:hypothetical protein
MATLQLEISEPIVQWYTSATYQQKQNVTQVIADILLLLSNNATQSVKKPPHHLAFKPFNAIQMRGKGPTASEFKRSKQLPSSKIAPKT